MCQGTILRNYYYLYRNDSAYMGKGKNKGGLFELFLSL